MTKKPDAIDVAVGHRLRTRRMVLCMSQEGLAERVGLTFQQIQKYEKGVNRIGASRLFRFAQILDVPVDYFFEDCVRETPDADATAAGLDEAAIRTTLNSREGLELTRAYQAIPQQHLRKSVVDLCKALSNGAAQ